MDPPIRALRRWSGLEGACGGRASSMAVTLTLDAGSSPLATSAVATRAVLARAAACWASGAIVETVMRFEPGTRAALRLAPVVSTPPWEMRSRTVRLLISGT